MRHLYRFAVLFSVLSVFTTSAVALEGRLATEGDIQYLKKDVVGGKIQVGKTRLKQIRQIYGDASKITETERKITYDYGDLRIEFEKERYFRSWQYDYTYGTSYTDDIDDLRFDLEDGQIASDYYSLSELRKDYGEPTKVFESYGDGEISVYYYGELKITFENVFLVRSWTGKNLDAKMDDGVLGTVKPESK